MMSAEAHLQIFVDKVWKEWYNTILFGAGVSQSTSDSEEKIFGQLLGHFSWKIKAIRHSKRTCKLNFESTDK